MLLVAAFHLCSINEKTSIEPLFKKNQNTLQKERCETAWFYEANFNLKVETSRRVMSHFRLSIWKSAAFAPLIPRLRDDWEIAKAEIHLEFVASYSKHHWRAVY